MKKISFLLPALVFLGSSVAAQHDQHPIARDTTPVSKGADSLHKHATPPKMQEPEMDHTMHAMPPHAFSLSLPMNRNASGTGWNPDASPMYMFMNNRGRTSWMFHGNIFLRYTRQDVFRSGKRGDESLSAPNWFMAMMNRKSGSRGLWSATVMLSLDKLTESGDGYPLLFQSGETWKGRRLIDRQHPHDLFSALSIGYTQMINRDLDIFIYAGYPGEPALGAPAFMHRVSAMNNPDAPLGHHWQDATHISFGTATLGVRYRQFKAEGSLFNGREPNEERLGFDPLRLNSYSFRLSYQPLPSLALQVSRAFIKSPEAIQPETDLHRTVASILYAKQKNEKKHFTATAIWGLNDQGKDHREQSFLLEANYRLNRQAIYNRFEWVQKSAEELDIVDLDPHHQFWVQAYTLGYNRLLTTFRGTDLAAGTQFTIHGVDKALQSTYGRMPLSFQLYLQIRPAIHKH